MQTSAIFYFICERVRKQQHIQAILSVLDNRTTECKVTAYKSLCICTEMTHY